MLKVKKSTRIFLAFVLTMTMVFSLATTVSAAGTETWYASEDVIWEDSFTIRGYNLTPAKTIGSTGTLLIGVSGHTTDGNSAPAILTVQIRLTNGTVLASNSISTDALLPHVQVEAPVTAGQKVQIYIGLYTNGNYRVGSVSYFHRIY